MNDENKTLQNKFGVNTTGTTQQDYAADADLSRTLLAELRIMLQPSATARRLMAMADQHGVTVKFLRGREEAVYVPENKWVFISLSPRTKASPTLALMYAGALREAEQNALGHVRPGQDVEPDAWMTRNVVKNVDIIRNMCIIVKEITEASQEDTRFLDSLRLLGHDDIYQALRNRATDEELLRLYAKKEQINVNEG
jgi:hypothetical protein